MRRPGSRGRRIARLMVVPLVAVASGCIVEASWTPRAVEPAVAPVADRVTLSDVACPAEGACVAVGTLGTLPTTSELAVLRQAGDGWERVDSPHAVPGARAVSCAAVDDCVVAGAVDMRYRDGELTLLPPAPLEQARYGGAVDCVPAGGEGDGGGGDGGGCLRTDGLTSSWWDGTAWSEPVALPAGMLADTPQLSCAAATACLLVGTEFGVEGWPTPGTVTSSTWDGTAWSSVVTLDHRTRPLDLDCATATACVATAGVRADYWTDLLPPVPAEVLRWDGTAWSVEPVTYPGGAVPTEPGIVSCPSATTCTVLSVAGASDPVSPTVVARWDGTTWSGAAADASGAVRALACASATSCTAVGPDVAQRGDGATWPDTALPSGTSPAEAFNAVSCAADDDCVAVGSGWAYGDGGAVELTPTLQRFDGGAWAVEDAGDRDLRHVSCATTTSCMAAGSDLGTFWTRHWDGTTWRELPPVSDLRAGGVSGLSCPTATWCLMTTTRYSNGEDMAWRWTGGDAWTPVAALPDYSGTSTALSCPVPDDCVAISNWTAAQAYRLTGGAWAPLELPAEFGGLGDATDVDCAAPGECAVVGSAYDDDGRLRALLAVLSPGEPAVVADKPGAEAIDVDCWSVDGCVAVASGDNPHLEAWDGTRWRPVANPPGLARPTAVSCPSPSRCEVVGGFVDGDDRAAAATVVLDP